jgi:HK97 family phage portal protein
VAWLNLPNPFARFKGLWSRQGGRWGGSTVLYLPGTRRDFAAEAGDPWRNSIVALGLAWLADRFPKPLVRVSRIAKSTGDYVPLPRHDAVDLWSRPNPWYGRRTMETALGLSLRADGNAYVHKLRDARGKVAQLWWLPHQLVEPEWPEDGSAFVDRYKVAIDGRDYYLPPEDVIHFRWGIDPDNTRKGLAPLKACLREVATDNQSSTYSATVLRNLGMPGIVVMPKDGTPEPTGEQAKEIRDDVDARTTGDRRGSTVVFKGRYDVTTVGLSPEQMALDKLTAQSIARVAAAIGVPAMVLGLPDPNKTFSNLDAATRSAWAAVTSIQDVIADGLRYGLLPDFGSDPAQHVWEYDYSAIAELNEEQDKLHARVRDDYKAGILLKNEARELLGLEPDPDGDVFMPGTGGGEPVAAPATPPGPPAPKPPVEMDDTEDLDEPVNGNGNGNGKALAWWDR